MDALSARHHGVRMPHDNISPTVNADLQNAQVRAGAVLALPEALGRVRAAAALSMNTALAITEIKAILAALPRDDERGSVH